LRDCRFPTIPFLFSALFVYNDVGDSMDGILLIDKPVGMSSHDCVDVARRAFDTRKVGHAGTLDVEASGVLVLGIGKGTKILRYLTDENKRYRFGLVIGERTDTLDHTGVVTESSPVEVPGDIDAVLASFEGTYTQTPPLYSAVKVRGRKLYEYMRADETPPERPKREVHVHSLKRTSDVESHDGLLHVELDLSCSKGLFVRALADDIAQAIGSVGRTSFIRRSKSGGFSLKECCSLDALKRGECRLKPLSDSLQLPTHVALDPGMIQNGRPIEVDATCERIKIVDPQGGLLAIYKRHEGIYKPERVM